MTEHRFHSDDNLGPALPPGNPVAGVTRAWTGEPPRRLPAGLLDDPGRPVFQPPLDRVSARHGRRYPPRALEPEVMDGEAEVDAYLDAGSQKHLEQLDAQWVAMVLAAGPRGAGRVIDVGTGSGQIPLALSRRRPAWRIWGVDRALVMLAAGSGHAGTSALAARREARPHRVARTQADARALPFPDGAGDLVLSNSLLHHLPDPSPVLDELARITAPGGRVLLRDLRRPPRWRYRTHVGWHGRHYGGTMRALYEASVAAAFTVEELTIILRHTALAGAAVRAEGPYLVVERGKG